jgi:hypothetical protein
MYFNAANAVGNINKHESLLLERRDTIDLEIS